MIDLIDKPKSAAGRFERKACSNTNSSTTERRRSVFNNEDDGNDLILPGAVGKSRVTRECRVRICERLGVKFPGPTRQKPTSLESLFSAQAKAATRHA